ncbi:hypothetical protein ASD54_12370 [Rhizobium sp. Root149]|uniref:hypothetical protein n=1 Tax=Rhizobium sp. Root149 TaxID=1736473 RepID=UPI0007154B43|nr:hypothetical protein [Rhizobium sp. Root149]KQZ49726.1 hypothetical protein ASD54_12370 [Rhizobium sp. Root149]
MSEDNEGPIRVGQAFAWIKADEIRRRLSAHNENLAEHAGRLYRLQETSSELRSRFSRYDRAPKTPSAAARYVSSRPLEKDVDSLWALCSWSDEKILLDVKTLEFVRQASQHNYAIECDAIQREISDLEKELESLQANADHSSPKQPYVPVSQPSNLEIFWATHGQLVKFAAVFAVLFVALSLLGKG